MTDHDNLTAEDLLPYLTEGRAAILTELWETTHEADSKINLATKDDLREAHTEAVGEDTEQARAESFEFEFNLLKEWGLIESVGRVSPRGKSGMIHPFKTPAAVDQMYEKYGPDIASEAVPRHERTAEQWRNYPVSLENKVAEIGAAVGDLANK